MNFLKMFRRSVLSMKESQLHKAQVSLLEEEADLENAMGHVEIHRARIRALKARIKRLTPAPQTVAPPVPRPKKKVSQTKLKKVA